MVVNMDADVRTIAVELLKAYKKVMKYRDLEKLTGLPAPGLWRYINKRIRPSHERAAELVEKLLNPTVVEKLLSERIVEAGKNIYNLSRIIYDIPMLKILSFIALREFQKYNITAVATVEVDGIPLGVVVAEVLNAKLVVARRRPEVGVKDYYQTSYLARDPPAIMHLFLPTTALGVNDRVLIVDDLLSTGRTSLALIKLVRMSGALTVGLFSIIALGNAWRELIGDSVEKIYVVMNLKGD